MQTEDNVVAMRAGRQAPEGTPSFEELFLDQHDRLYRALYFITGNAADAEELMQDAFLRLWERWDTVDRIEDTTAYLPRVALNGFRMRVRRARVAARRLSPVSESHDPYVDVDIREDVRRMLLGFRRQGGL